MWDGARNLADLGGLELVAGGETKRGRVFRSAARDWMTDRGWGEARDAGGGLRAAVALGGDTDTNGAVTGALLGARVGASGLPAAWLGRLVDQPSIEAEALHLAANVVPT